MKIGRENRKNRKTRNKSEFDNQRKKTGANEN